MDLLRPPLLLPFAIPTYTGFEPPSTMIAKVVLGKVIPDQLKLIADLKLHHQIAEAKRAVATMRKLTCL